MINHDNKRIYHIYPLSFGTDAARRFGPQGLEHSPGQSGPIREPEVWADHIQGLGFNTILLGPIWLSESHGYDTLDYRQVDPRVGSNEDFKHAVEHFHARGMDVVVDGVFNHSARGFFAFRDLCEKAGTSSFRDWYKNLDFGCTGPQGLGFAYSGWHGYDSLPEFNLGPDSPASAWLLDTVQYWIHEFGIDGIRLDAADCLDQSFMRQLSQLCRKIKPGFWLMGEVIHGDYASYVHQGGLDSVTNYEAFKGMWSSHNDKNFHEIAWTLKRQFGEHGTCSGWLPQTFTDNHDVSRLASQLKDPRHLYPVMCLAWTIPGIPGIYYGTEAGWKGLKERDSDWNLRPAITPGHISKQGPHKDLCAIFARLNRLREDHPALRGGDFTLIDTGAEHLAFQRICQEDSLVVVVNAHEKPTQLTIKLPGAFGTRKPEDVLNPGNHADLDWNMLKVTTFPCWAQIYRL